MNLQNTVLMSLRVMIVMTCCYIRACCSKYGFLASCLSIIAGVPNGSDLTPTILFPNVIHSYYRTQSG